MIDVVDPATRSRMMAGIRGKNTKPEIMVRKTLHARGFRFRLHRKDLQGSPDLVLPKYRAVIFINGCFWHGHDCHLFKWPQTRSDFWYSKIKGNIYRDQRSLDELLRLGWRVCTLWECEIKGVGEYRRLEVIDELESWLKSSSIKIDMPHSRTQCE